MTREKIIAMAREANLRSYPEWINEVPIVALERFAALVAVAAIKDAPDYKMGYADGIASEREKLKNDIHSCGPTCTRYACVAVREAVEAEREACAKVCDSRYMGDNNREDMEAKRCAAAIRARKDNT